MEHRILSIYALLLMSFTVLVIRLSVLVTSEKYQAVAAAQGFYTLDLGETRGMIYDRNFKPLLAVTPTYWISVAPSSGSAAALRENMPERFPALLPQMESGKPLLIRSDYPIEGEGLLNFLYYEPSDERQIAPHVMGYLQNGKGAAGVQAGYDSLLRALGGRVRTTYPVNAAGGVLGDGTPEVSDTRPYGMGGLVLTLDRAIQKIAEQAAEPIQKGAVVVMDVETGEILAVVSKPDFSVDSLSEALHDPDSPLFFRAAAAYSVGSTFKIAVTAAALENGWDTDYSALCPGYYQLGEQRYYCHLRSGHWEIALPRALEQSCNPFFITLGQEIGGKKLLEMAQKMGFGRAEALAEGIPTASGTLPTLQELTAGELANLSFGQGKLTATPVQIAQMTAIVANGGHSVTPTLYRGSTMEGSVLITRVKEEPTQILKPETAKKLQELLCRVVARGSGKNAAPSYGTAGGKTASAQTGQMDGEQEIVHGWFTGFYPAESPRYAITVLEEGGGSGGALPAQVFREICNEVAFYDNPILRRQVEQ